MLLFCDSFDHYNTAAIGQKYNTYGMNGTLVVSDGSQYTGSQCLNINGGAGPYINVANKTRLIVGTRFRSLGGKTAILTLTDTAGTYDTNLILYLNSDGSVTAYKSWNYGAYSTTYGVSAAGVANLGSYDYYEVKFFCDGNAGSVQVRVNGVLVIDASGINTVAGSSNPWIGTIGLRGTGAGYNSYHDDLYVLDWSTGPLNGFLGPVRVYCCLPSADSSPLQWTPSAAGSHYPLVSSVPPDTSKYVSSNTAGQIDQYLHSLAAVPGNLQVLGIQHCLCAALDAAGSASVASCVGGVAATAAALTTTAYGYIVAPYSVNPAAGNPWTVSDAAALGFGPKITVGGGSNARVTQSVIEVIGPLLPQTFQAFVLG